MTKILTVAKRLSAHMGALRAFLSDNGTEWTNHLFVELSGNLGICRKLKASYPPEQDVSIESEP